ncbi:MAG: hypothetical protein DLD55_01760 [candidate division SR1 bacterium]|nr:MAG: hypothetical protein DLD55_01760 [candidate division SR1 bacterium]
MTIKTTDFWDQTAHLKVIDEVFQESVQDKLSDLVGLKIFDDETTKRRNDTMLIEDGLTGVSYIPEGSEYPDAKPGDTNTFTLQKFKYGAKVVISEEMKMYNEHGSMAERIRSIVDDGMEMIDQSLADILLRGFSTASYTDVFGKTMSAIGQMGRALFNAEDNNIIKVGNVQHPKLCAKALDAAYVMGATRKNRLGQNKAVKYNLLIVSPLNLGKAKILVNSEKMPGSADNAININKDRFKIVEWSRLSTLMDGQDTSEYWFVADSKKIKKQLKIKWARHPELIAPKEVAETGDDLHRFSYIYSRGFLNFPYIAGSKGTNLVEDDPIRVKTVS